MSRLGTGCGPRVAHHTNTAREDTAAISVRLSGDKTWVGTRPRNPSRTIRSTGCFRKFGAGAAESREIILAAAKLGADLAGVTFHAGSQCRNPENWRVGIEKARTLFDVMVKAGLKPRLLDIGGGTASGRPVRTVQVGGPLGAYLSPEQMDLPVDYEAFNAAGALLGHGSMVVFDDTVNMAAMARFAAPPSGVPGPALIASWNAASASLRRPSSRYAVPR